MSETTIDVVIPVHSALTYLRGCVNSIFENEHDFQLILVNDQSDEPTKEYLNSLKNRAFVLDTPGHFYFTRTINMGLRKSTAPWILLLNSDIEVVTPDSFGGLIACAKKWHAGVVGAKLLNSDGTINHAGAYGVGFHFGMNEENVNYFDEREVEWITGACLLIRRSVIETIGHLDDRYVHVGSDREYCHRARSYGFKIVYSPITMIHHNEKSKDNEAAAVVENQHSRNVY